MARSEIPKIPRSTPMPQNDNRVTKRTIEGKVDVVAVQKFYDLYKENQDSPLLKLPGELRNKIYGYVLGGHEIFPKIFQAALTPSSVDTWFKWVRKFSASVYGHPSKRNSRILAQLHNFREVSSQIYHETKLFSVRFNIINNTFDGQFDEFLKGLDDEKKNAITTIWFGPRTKADFYACELHRAAIIPGELKKCLGLKTVIFSDTLEATERKKVLAFAKSRSLKVLVDRDDGAFH